MSSGGRYAIAAKNPNRRFVLRTGIILLVLASGVASASAQSAQSTADDVAGRLIGGALAFRSDTLLHEDDDWSLESNGPAHHIYLPVVGVASTGLGRGPMGHWRLPQWASAMADAFSATTGYSARFEPVMLPVYWLVWSNLTVEQQQYFEPSMERFQIGDQWVEVYEGPNLVTLIRCSDSALCVTFERALIDCLKTLSTRLAAWRGYALEGEQELLMLEQELPLRLTNDDAETRYRDAQVIAGLSDLQMWIHLDFQWPTLMQPSIDAIVLQAGEMARQAEKARAEESLLLSQSRQANLGERIQRANELHQNRFAQENAQLALTVATAAAIVSLVALLIAVAQLVFQVRQPPKTL